MASGADHDLLTAALERAWRAYLAQTSRPTILSGPSEAILSDLCKAIEDCSAFAEVAGLFIYSGGSGPVIQSHLFASRLFSKVEQSEGKEISLAADWLLQLLATREAAGLFKVAVWGASIDRDCALQDGSCIISFDALPDTHMKSRILERARGCYDKSSWLAHNYFDAPKLALVREVPNFPYICGDITPFRIISDLQAEARDLWLFVEAAVVGHPLAIGCWFEYADRELDINGWENSLAWVLPEIPPRVSSVTAISAAKVQSDMQRYNALPDDIRSRLLRSMERFTLSQCRHQYIDRILDLELAFEIAVSGPARDSAPMG